MKMHFIKTIIVFVILMVSSQAFAQKLLDPAASSGPISIVTASSGGVNTSVALAYSIRRLKTTYDHAAITAPTAVSGFTNSTTPLIRVRRSSNNDQLDIGALASGMLDTVTLKSFVGSGSGYISIWFDQSGNSRDAIQTTTASQPRIVNAGVVEVNSNGIPGIATISGSYINDGGTATNAPSGSNRYGITGNRTLNMVAQPRSYTNGTLTLGDGTYLADRNGGGAQDNPLTSIKAIGSNWALQLRMDDGSGLSSSFTGAVGISIGRSDNVTVTRNSSNAYVLYVNGVSAGSATVAGANSMSPVRVGIGIGSSENIYCGEVLLFPSELSAANLAVINNSQNVFFVTGVAGTQTWTGVSSTDWNTAANWSNGAVPTSTSEVIIPSGTANAITITSGQTTLVAKKITVNSGATVTINGNLSISDSVNVIGTVNGTGTITLNGSAQRVVGTLCGLIINSSVSIFAIGDLTVNGALTLNAGAYLNMGTNVLSGTLTSITNSSGFIITANTSSTPIPSGKTWGGYIYYSAIAGGQTIMSGTYTNLTLSNASGTQTASGNLTVNGALTFNAGGTLSMGTNVLSGTLTSITNSSGFIITANTSSTPIPSGKTWGGYVYYSAIAGGQTIMSGTYTNLTLSNASGTQTASGNLTVDGTLTTQSGGTLSMGTNALSGTLSTIANSGTITTANTSATPIPAGKTWNGTVNYNAASGTQTIAGGTYNNLGMNNTSGTQTAGGNINVDGTLTVASGGTLDMNAYALYGNLTTITNNGTIKTSSKAQPPLGLNKTWSGSVLYSLPGDTIMLSYGTYNNLTLSSNVTTVYGSSTITVNGAFTASGEIYLNDAALDGTMTSVSSNGIIYTSNTTSTPLPAGKTWGGFIMYSAANGGQTIVGGTYSALYLAHSSGTSTASGNLTVNSMLALLGNGTLSMGTNTLGGTLSSITNVGTITTASTSATALPSGKTWGGTIGYNALTGGQTVVNGTYNNLTLSNTSGIQTASGNLTVNGTLTTTSGGTLNLSTYTLGGTLTTINNNGTIRTDNTSGTPLPSGKNWGGTIEYGAATGGQTVMAATYNNLTLSNTSGSGSAMNNLTVNGTLTTTSGGTLDLLTYTLSGTLTTITNNGTIKTSNTSATPLPTGKTWTGTIEYGAAAGGQAVMGGATATYTSLKMSNTSGISNPAGDLTVNNTFSSVAGGTLNMGPYKLYNPTTIDHNGILLTANTSSTPLPAGKTWGGTVRYIATAGSQTVAGGTYNNLEFTNTSGTNTANGVVNVNNSLTVPASTTLDMASYQLGGAISGTLSMNGTLKTANTTTVALPTFKTWGGTVEYNNPTGGQYIAGGTYNNLIFSNSSGSDVVYTTNLVVNGTLTTTSGGTLNLSTYTLGGTLATINNNGTIRTDNTSATPLPSGRTWGGTIEYGAATGGQTVMGGAAASYTNLKLSNTSGTSTASGTITMNGALITTAGGTFDLGTNTLSGTLTTTTNNGTIKTANTSATPLPAGITWGGTVMYNATTGGQKVMDGTYNNLTLSNTSGMQTANGNITISNGGSLTTAAGGTFYMSTYSLSESGTATFTGHNGFLLTASTAVNPLPSGKTWGGEVRYGSTLSQTIVGGTFNYLYLASSNSTTAAGNITISNGGTFRTIFGSSFDLGTYMLSEIGTTTVTHRGTLMTANTSATPLPSGKTWGLSATSGIVIYNAPAGGQTVVGGSYAGLTLANSSGTQTATGAITMLTSGTLTNPSGSTLDMGAYALTETTSSTMNNNGTIKTANTSAIPLPSGKTWGGTVEYNNASGGQVITDGTYNNLTVSNTSGTQTALNNLTINGTLATAAGGILNLSTYTLGGTLAAITNNGTIKTSNTSATPLPTGKTWGGTIEYGAAAGAQTVMAATYNNLTMSNTSGTSTASGNIIVNGALTTIAGGTFDLVTNTLGGTLTGIASSGTLKTANTSATPLPAGITWGGTVMYNATSGSQSVVNGTYYNLTLGNTSGTQTANGSITISNGGTLTIPANTTLDMQANVLSETGTATFTNNGTIATKDTTATPLPARNWTTGTIHYNRSSGLQKIMGGTYNNLTLGQTSGGSTTSGDIAVNGALTVTNSGALLNLVTYTLTGTLTAITNNGAIRTYNTSSLPLPSGKNWGTTGTIEYAGATGGQTVVAGTYYKITLFNSSGTQTAGGDISMPTAGGGLTNTNAGGTLNMGTYALTAPSTGMNFVNNGTIKTSNTTATPIPAGVSWGGTIEYAAAGQTVMGGSSATYTSLKLSHSSGTSTASGNLVVSGTFTTTSGGTLSMGTNSLGGTLATISNSGTLTTAYYSSWDALPSGRTWGGTVVYNSPVNTQLIIAGTYNNLSAQAPIQNAADNLVVNGTFTTAANTYFQMDQYALSGSLSTVDNNGIFFTENTSAAPVPAGKTWGGTMIYYAATGGQSVASGTYNNLTLSNTSGTQTANGNITLSNGGTLTVDAGSTLDMQTNALLETGTATFTSNGTIITTNIATTPAIPAGKTWPGTVIYNATTGGQKVAGGTYNILTLSNTSGTQTANGSITISNGGALTIPATTTLDMGTNILSETGTATFTNNGTIATKDTTATPLPARNWTTGTIHYNRSSGLQKIMGGTYNNLTVGQTSGGSTTSGDIVVNGALNVTNSGALLNLGTYTLTGTLTAITNNGAIRTYNTSSLPLPSGKNWGTTGTIEYAGTTGGQTVVAGSYYKITLFNTSGTQTAGGNISMLTAGGGLTNTNAGGILDMGSYALTAPPTGMNFVNNGTIKTANATVAPIPNGIVWGGTINYNKAGGSQSISSTTFNNLTLGNTSGLQFLNGTITVNGTLLCSSGTGKLLMGSNTVNINGTLSGHTASTPFVANGSSSISIGGSGALGSSLFFDQTTPGTTNRLTNFTYNRSSQTITLGNALQVAGTVTPTAGILATGNALTLVSNATNTARIAAGSGTYITGNVIAERYIPSVARRWRFMASPVSGSTLADWKNEIYITGTGGTANGFDSTLSNAAGVYTYDETTPGEFNANGWVAATNISNALTVGKGFRVFIRGDRSDPNVLNGNTGTQAAVTMNAIGPANTGNITMPVSYTNSGNNANDGWSFVGNPYPSPIDWNAFHDAGRTGSSPDYSGTDYAHLDAVASVYDVNIANYASYNAASNIGTGAFSNGIIPSGGSFWVKASAASPSMTMKEIYKTGSTPAAMFKDAGPQPAFSLKLSKDEITADETVVKYMNEATNNFDMYDIAKLNGEVNLSSITNDGTLLTGNCKPFNGISDSIRLNITAAKSGNYFIEVSNANMLAPGKNIYLVDAFTHAVIDLNAASKYDLTIDKDNASSYGNKRLTIVVGDLMPTTGIEEQATAHAMMLYPAITSGEVTINNSKAGTEKVEVTITDAAGKQIASFDNLHWNDDRIMLDLSTYQTGVYFVAVSAADQQQVFKCVKQ